MILNTWSVSVRYMWKLPYQTHRYFIEPLGGTHLKNMLFSRFTKFLQSIEKTNKNAAVYLLNRTIYNQRTITGKNVNLILKEISEDDIMEVEINQMKKNMEFLKLPLNHEWKVNLVKELTNMKMNILSVDFDDTSSLSIEEIDDVMIFVTTS